MDQQIMIRYFNMWQRKYNNNKERQTMTKKKDTLDKWLKDHVHYETFSFNKKTKKQKKEDKQIQNMLHKKLKEDLIKNAI